MRFTKRFWIIYTVSLLVAASAVIAVIALYGNRRNSYESRMTVAGINQTTQKTNEERIVKLPQDDTPAGEAAPIKGPVPVPECSPEEVKFKWEISNAQNKILSDFKRSYELSFDIPGHYSVLEGIPCFRGNNYRDSASYGNPDIQVKKLEKVWSIKIGYIDTWTGVGWNGQPAIVKWAPSVRKVMNLYPSKKSKESLKEIIYATLDGKIYFLDLDDGSSTRPVINVGAPHKGSVSVDPRGYPLLYAGQGIDEIKGKRINIGYRIFNLIDQKQLYFINGFDPFALRSWGAFDSTSLVDRKTDTFIECGENGILYTAKLNTRFDDKKGSISIKPELYKYRYYSPKKETLGMENSPTVYKNYIYFADNSGTLQCIDLNTLTPVWIRDVTDDTDSTTALEEEDNGVSLFTACEIDKQGKIGYSYIRKLDAMTGKLLWEKSVKCVYDSVTNGGALGSPIIGKKDISDLIIYNIAKTSEKTRNSGKLIAFSKKNGNEIWSLDLQYYSWSSPVAVYDKSGKSYIVFCDSIGNMFLIEGKTGKILDKISLGANIEGSPAIYEDMIVVGTRGQKIWGVRLK